MREPTVARNYAEVLVSLAAKSKDLDGWGKMIDAVAEAASAQQHIRLFLQSPRVAVKQKNEILGEALSDRLPAPMVRFIQAVVSHRRQNLFTEIAVEYHALVDERTNRVHAQVQVVREPSDEQRKAITRQLARITGKTVVPHFQVQPRILGGVVARIGDTVMDGSLARRLARIRTQALGTAAR